MTTAAHFNSTYWLDTLGKAQFIQYLIQHPKGPAGYCAILLRVFQVFHASEMWLKCAQ